MSPPQAYTTEGQYKFDLKLLEKMKLKQNLSSYLVEDSANKKTCGSTRTDFGSYKKHSQIEMNISLGSEHEVFKNRRSTVQSPGCGEIDSESARVRRDSLFLSNQKFIEIQKNIYESTFTNLKNLTERLSLSKNKTPREFHIHSSGLNDKQTKVELQNPSNKSLCSSSQNPKKPKKTETSFRLNHFFTPTYMKGSTMKKWEIKKKTKTLFSVILTNIRRRLLQMASSIKLSWKIFPKIT